MKLTFDALEKYHEDELKATMGVTKKKQIKIDPLKPLETFPYELQGPGEASPLNDWPGGKVTVNQAQADENEIKQVA